MQRVVQFVRMFIVFIAAFLATSVCAYTYLAVIKSFSGSESSWGSDASQRLVIVSAVLGLVLGLVAAYISYDNAAIRKWEEEKRIKQQNLENDTFEEIRKASLSDL